MSSSVSQESMTLIVNPAITELLFVIIIKMVHESSYDFTDQMAFKPYLFYMDAKVISGLPFNIFLSLVCKNMNHGYIYGYFQLDKKQLLIISLH